MSAYCSLCDAPVVVHCFATKKRTCRKKIRKYLRVRADTDLPLSRISPLFIRLLPAIVSTICVPSLSVVAMTASTSAAPASRVIPRRNGNPSEPEASTPRNCKWGCCRHGTGLNGSVKPSGPIIPCPIKFNYTFHIIYLFLFKNFEKFWKKNFEREIKKFIKNHWSCQKKN